MLVNLDDLQTHVAASLIIDLQPMLPDTLVPTVIRNLPISYVKMSNDPLIGGAMGILDNKDQLVWFRTFLGLEMYGSRLSLSSEAHSILPGYFSYLSSSWVLVPYGKV